MMEASLYDKIMDQQRLEPEFFRVGFYGKKFPFFLRVKTHIISIYSMLNCVMLFQNWEKPAGGLNILLHKTPST